MRKYYVPLLFIFVAVGALVSPLVLFPSRAQDSSPYARYLLQRSSDPAGVREGQLYANTASHAPKYYNGSSWLSLISSGDTGTVTNAMLAGSIANNKLANSTISGVALGGNLFTLTLGTGLSGTSYNGSANVTAAVSNPVPSNLTLANPSASVTLTPPATSVQVSGTLHVFSTAGGAGNSGTGETTLDTYTLPASALDVNGKTLRIIAVATTANNANNKTLRIYFGSTVICTPQNSTTGNGVAYCTGYVTRTGAATQTAWMRGAMGGGGNETQNNNTVTTPAETLSGTVTIKVTGQSNTASNDITLVQFIIEILN